MQNFFIIVTTVIGVGIAYLYPVVAVGRGSHAVSVIGKAWLGLVAYFAGLCLLLPAIVSIFSNDLAREISSNWVPEATAVLPALFMGWLPPIPAALVGLALRSLVNRISVAKMNRKIENQEIGD